MKPFILLIASATFCNTLSKESVMLEPESAPYQNNFGSEKTLGKRST
jgi:hypothetical protein